MTLTKKFTRGLQEVPIEVNRLLRGYYPAFVTKERATPSCDEVPVFMFHSVDEPTFHQQLEYLRTNNYATLSLHDFMAFLRGELRLRQPSVLLTFDDGEKSWYRVVYPLLKAYGYQAVFFVVPAYILEQPAKAQGKGWLAWPELREMEASGVADIQSHSYYHDRIFTGPELVDFYHPGFGASGLRLDIPWIGEGETYTNRLPLGTPIYKNKPRLAGNLRYLDDERLREACTAFIEEQGGTDFFARPTWRKDLEQVYRQHRRGRPAKYESPDEQRARILENFTRAKEVIEERLGKSVEHFCYPNGAGSPLAVSLSQQAGYQSNFWVAPGVRGTNRACDSPYYIPRLKDDYLFRIPGRGRVPLLKIFQRKLGRRAGTLDLY